MNVSENDVVTELKQLRKGRGIAAPQLPERVGTALRAVCGISDVDDVAELRRKVSQRLQALAARLQDDLRIVFLAAFALHKDARMPFYQDRVAWAAMTLQRDDRTVRRRIDVAIGQVASSAAAETAEADSEHPSRSWHTEELRVALALDQPVPEAFEYRQIMADADDLEELDLALTLTNPDRDERRPAAAELEVDVFHGGVLTRRTMESNDRIGLSLRLPELLHRGQKHELALRFRANFRHPHYVCVPRHPCRLFDLHVRFPRPVPGEVVQLDRVFQDDARDLSTHGAALVPDNSGEVHVQFRDLAPGFAYGVRWDAVAAN